jgi:hypothetical protein
VIWDNDGLQSLRGIGPFTQLFSRLWIDTNPLLTDLTGLDVSPSNWMLHGRTASLPSACRLCRATANTRGLIQTSAPPPAPLRLNAVPGSAGL